MSQLSQPAKGEGICLEVVKLPSGKERVCAPTAPLDC